MYQDFDQGPGKLDLAIKQGGTFSMILAFNNPDGSSLDVSQYTFSGAIKTNYSSATPLVTFTFTPTPNILNQVTVSLSATQTSSLPVYATTRVDLTQTPYCYDIKALLPDAVTVKYYLEGYVRVDPQVTQ